MFENSVIRLGIAPIAWTNDDMPDLGAENTFGQCVSEIALAGFAGCEIGCKYPKDAAVLKKALDLRGLAVANAWFSAFLTVKPFAETEREFIAACDFLRACGSERIGVSEQGHSIQGQAKPVFTAKHVMNAEEWNSLCTGLDALGRIARDKGLHLVYHHHMGTVVQTADETKRMLDNTDPDLVGLLFDTGHFAYSGEDPLAVARRHMPRIEHVHLKDIRPDRVRAVRESGLSFLDGVREGTFTVPGDGGIDFVPVFQALSDAGYSGWMLVEAEQDPALANPLEYAMKARAYIKKTTGL